MKKKNKFTIKENINEQNWIPSPMEIERQKKEEEERDQQQDQIQLPNPDDIWDKLKLIGNIILFKLVQLLNILTQEYTALLEQVAGKYTFCKLRQFWNVLLNNTKSKCTVNK